MKKILEIGDEPPMDSGKWIVWYRLRTGAGLSEAVAAWKKKKDEGTTPNV